MSQTPKKAPTLYVQLIIGFVIPTVILFALSDPDRLGPLPAMLIALALPIVLELYSLRYRRKPSLVSIASIIGILFIGVVTLLGLNEQWLAVRRSALYFIAAIALLYVARFKPQLIDKGLNRILDMEGVRLASQQQKSEAIVKRSINLAMYWMSAILVVIGFASYVLTLVFINSPAGTGEFNAEYAELRIASIIAITIPFIIATTIVLTYVLNKFEKITGISAEALLRKKK